MSSLGLSHLFLPCDDFLPVAQLTQHGTQPLMCSVVSFTYVCTMPSRSGTPPQVAMSGLPGPDFAVTGRMRARRQLSGWSHGDGFVVGCVLSHTQTVCYLPIPSDTSALLVSFAYCK